MLNEGYERYPTCARGQALCLAADATGELMQRTTCLLEESFEISTGVVMVVAKVTKVAIERAPPIEEVEGTVGLTRADEKAQSRPAGRPCGGEGQAS